MPGHRQPLASPDGEVFSPRCRKDVLCSWHTVLYARPLFRKKRRIYIYIIIQIFLNFFQKTVSKRRTLSGLNWSLMCSQKASKAFWELLRPSKPASVSGIRYRRGSPMVRNMRAVLKKASWGTRRIFIRLRCKKQASTVRKRYSVRKTGSSGTRRIFKGPQNSTCRIERIFKGPQNSRLHRLWTAHCRTERGFSARNSLREEVSRHKKR